MAAPRVHERADTRRDIELVTIALAREARSPCAEPLEALANAPDERPVLRQRRRRPVGRRLARWTDPHDHCIAPVLHRPVIPLRIEDIVLCPSVYIVGF